MDEPRCILVVEDNAEILRLMQIALARHDYDVRTATSAYEALDILGTGEPQLLILDLMMPLISGWDVLAIRATDPRLRRIPTIVVTATDAFDKVDAATYGAAQAIRSADGASGSRRVGLARYRGTKHHVNSPLPCSSCPHHHLRRPPSPCHPNRRRPPPPRARAARDCFVRSRYRRSA